MKLLNRLERSLGGYAIPNVTLYFVLLQACTFLVVYANPTYAQRMALDRGLVLQGEWWRLLTFIVLPPLSGPFWVIIALMFFYWIGSNLENHWGSFRYNLYLLIGYLASAAAAMIVPGPGMTNGFFLTSVLVAFAWLFPDAIIRLYFIIPCKIKWIGALAWIGYLYAFFDGGWDVKAAVLAAILPFVLFFQSDLRLWVKLRRHRVATFDQRLDKSAEAFHVCAACGVTDKTNPTMEFRYCPQCTGTPGYCIDHIKLHTHR